MSVLFPLIETFAPVIPLITYGIKRPMGKRWVVILLIYFIVYIFLAAFANFSPELAKNNILVYVIITVFTFISFILLIECFIDNKNLRRLNLVLVFSFIAFAIFNAKRIEELKYFNSYTSSLSAIILISYCVYYYWLQILNPKDYFIYRQSSFWIVTGIFIYCGGNFFLFTNYRELCIEAQNLYDIGNKPDSHKLWVFAESIWIIADLLILFTNIFFAKAILCLDRK